MTAAELLIKIGADTSDFDSKLKNAESEASSFGSTALSKIGGGLKTAAKVGVAAVGAAATAVGALTMKAVDSYAEFEQLKGGVEKLYGTAADTLMNYANQAYATSGMSANQYMEQATSFSAALINSLGGDVQKAAEQTDVAMRAMSDNVNTFGTDMESVQNAFQGFAKQNYTMLDNLKLGYGGTKEGMQQLIADANEYAASIGQASDLSIDSFSDIVTAIELVQEKQGIAGTTAKEAASTISGSLEMTKASWDNLVAGFANPDADIGELISNFADSASMAFENLLPAVGQALEGIGQFISDAIPTLLDMLPEAIQNGAPMLLEAAINLVASIVESLPEIFMAIVDTIPVLWESIKAKIEEYAPEAMKAGQDLIGNLIEGLSGDYGGEISAGTDIITGLIDSILDALPDVINTGLEIISALLEGITENAGEVLASAGEILSSFTEGIMDALPQVWDGAAELILEFVNGVIDNLPEIADGATQAITTFWETVLENAPQMISAGAETLAGLIQGIGEAIPDLVAKIPEVVSAIWDNVSSVNWLELGSNVLNAVINGLMTVLGALGSTMLTLANAAWEAFKGIDWLGLGSTVLQFVINGLLSLLGAIGSTLMSIATAGWNAFKNIDWLGLGSSVINFIIDGLVSIGSTIADTLLGFANSAWDAVTNTDWLSLGSNIVNGIVDGITSVGSTIKDTLTNLASDALSAAKDFLGIKSPSRVFRDEVGKQIALGIAEGIRQNADYAEKSAEEIASATLQAAQKKLDNAKVYQILTLADEVAFWDSVRKQVESGTQARIDADKKYFDAVKKMREKQKSDEEKDYQVRLDKYTTYIGKVLKVATAAGRALKKLTQEEDLFDTAKKWLSNQQVYFETSAKYEMNYWNEIRKGLKKGTQARIDADEQYFKARDKYINSKKEAKKNAKDLTDAYIKEYNSVLEKRDAKIAQIKQKRNEQLKKIDDELEKDLEANEEDLAEKIDKINDKLADDIQKLTDKYNDSVQSRYQSIMGMTGLLSRTSYDRTYSKEYMMEALKDQTEALEDWDSELDTLQSRLGKDNPILKEFEDMGISSLYTLKELNSMSNAELEEYAALYDKKSSLAHERAVQENESLLEETNTQIQSLRDIAAANIAEFERQAEENRQKLEEVAEKERKEIREEAKANIQELKADARQQLKELTKEYKTNIKALAKETKTGGKDVGKSLCDGIRAGIKNNKSAITEAAKEAAQAALKAAKDELGIASPSKKFAWIGKMVDEGFAKGISDNMGLVSSQLDNLVTMPSDIKSTNGAGGFIQNLTINSPQALEPSEVARQTRLANQQMVLALRGV